MALVLWFAILYLGRVRGLLLELQGHQMVLFTPPLLGGYRDAVPLPLVLPLLVAAGLVVGLPMLAARLRWGWACVAGVASSLVWGVVLAVVDGNEGLVSGLESEREYQPSIDRIATGAGRWLSQFTAPSPAKACRCGRTHRASRCCWAPSTASGCAVRAGVPRSVIAVAVSGVAAVLIAVREVCDEATARRAMPFVALTPAVLFFVTSFDGLYMGISAWFVAALSSPCTVRGGPQTGGRWPPASSPPPP